MLDQLRLGFLSFCGRTAPVDDAPPNERIQRLFDDAASLSAEDRRRFLDNNCRDETERAELENLLKYDAITGGGLTGDVEQTLAPTQDVVESRLGRGPRLTDGFLHHGQFVPGTVLSERYRIVGMLGKGGMGEVYRADDLELGQSVALKFLPKKLAEDPRALERFRGEVRLARQVSHPNVCRVYDIGQIDGQWFLSMEYVDGEDLAQLLTRIGRFNAERATELARQLCLGLQAAHEKGVLHRDLKPANIMIDGRGKLLITDFGLAEIADDIRQEDIRSGTPAYMSPEQLAGREVTELSDIYSLGIVMHELFTGQPVWRADSMAELFEKRKSGTAPSPSSHVADLDPAVEQVIQRCLEPDPAKRPSSALQVIASLPGGDPLAAALGAGETPSPEMVAAAGGESKFDPRVAIATLVGTIACLLLSLWLSKSSAVNQSDLKYEPAILRNEIQEMLVQDFGYAEPIAESIDGFGEFSFLAPEELYFWYRQVPGGGSLEMTSFMTSDRSQMSRARPDFLQPIQHQPGELSVIVAGDQRLLYFRAVPEVDSEHADETSAPRWSEWFPPERIGYHLSNGGGNASPTEDAPAQEPTLEFVKDQTWAPTDAFDAVGVWEGENPDGSSFLIQAAAFRGKPTYFRRIDKVDIPTSASGDAAWIWSAVYLVLLLAGVLLAYRNVRSGRVDWVGGGRLAAYIFLLASFRVLAHCRLTTDIASLTASVAVMGLSEVLQSTFRMWVWYMALEPYVRKIWPQILISSSRLLEGRLTDPRVGRDLLVGSLFGVLIVLVSQLAVELLSHVLVIPKDPRSFEAVTSTEFLTLDGTRALLGAAALAHAWALFGSMLVLMSLLIARILLGTERRAVLGTFAVYTVLLALSIKAPLIFTIVPTAICIGLLLFLTVRFGVLAAVAQMTCSGLINNFPLTLDTSRWYFSHGMFAVTLIILVALYGFYTSIHGRSTLLPKAARLRPAG
jgi:serine/threonine-protein kinase